MWFDFDEHERKKDFGDKGYVFMGLESLWDEEVTEEKRKERVGVLNWKGEGNSYTSVVEYGVCYFGKILTTKLWGPSFVYILIT